MILIVVNVQTTILEIKLNILFKLQETFHIRK